MALRLKKIGRSSLLVLVGLLAATVTARPPGTLLWGIGALPPDVQILYDAGQYRQAAEALQAEVERNPRTPHFIFGSAAASLNFGISHVRFQTSSALSRWC